MAEGIMKRHPNLIYYRMLGYTVTLTTHTWNVMHLTNTFQGDILNDPDTAYYDKYVDRMLTVWLAIIQLCYSILGLSCDIMTLGNAGKDSALLKALKNIRDPVLSLFIVPVTMVVSIMFWTVYSYDPTLVIPPTMVNIMPSISNHIMHTFVVPATLWEIVFRPRKVPESHTLNFLGAALVPTVYISVLYITLYESQKFPYPILNMTYGTPYVHVILGTAFIGKIIFYRLQWYLTEYLWGNTTTAKKIK